MTPRSPNSRSYRTAWHRFGRKVYMGRIRRRDIVLLLLSFATFGPGCANANSEDGKEIYQRECAHCHGANGRPTVPDAPDFSRGESLIATDSRLLDRISRGNRAMPGYENILTDREILAVITYLRTLF